MKTNHPAYGPVSLDRLRQIRETLSKASAQSDGGNLGYAMSDAVKVIDGAIEAFGAEPVAWTDEEELRDAKVAGIGYLFGIDKDANKFADPRRQIMLYRHAQPVPVVPDEMPVHIGPREFGRPQAYVDGWNACRAAMLQAGNSPVAPDTWIPVSERMPGRSGVYMVWNGKHIGAVSLFFGSFQCIKPEQITHWRHMPAAPQEEKTERKK